MTQQVLYISALRSHVQNADGYPKIRLAQTTHRADFASLTNIQT